MPKLYPVDEVCFCAKKFKQRYKLGESDFKYGLVGSQFYVAINDGIVLPDTPPIFDAPDELEPKSKTEYALDIASVLAPKASATEIATIADSLLKLIGERPPDMKVVKVVPLTTATTSGIAEAVSSHANTKPTARTSAPRNPAASSV